MQLVNRQVCAGTNSDERRTKDNNAGTIAIILRHSTSVLIFPRSLQIDFSTPSLNRRGYNQPT
jgi:hypothetical protein